MDGRFHIDLLSRSLARSLIGQEAYNATRDKDHANVLSRFTDTVAAAAATTATVSLPTTA